MAGNNGHIHYWRIPTTGHMVVAVCDCGATKELFNYYYPDTPGYKAANCNPVSRMKARQGGLKGCETRRRNKIILEAL